jgi:septal ring-binding cell division protein DamX
LSALPPSAVTESYAGLAASPDTVSKPAPAAAAASPAASGSGPSPGAVLAAAAASPLCFTLRMPADSSANFEGGSEEQQRQLLVAFERALPGVQGLLC